jgi:Tripartite tricarboxylate transporter family receptor
VPYRGAGPAMADLISGQVAMVVVVTGQSLGFHRSGKLRILAVTSPKRLIAAPELPTVADAGFPGLTNLQTIGPVAPAGTPKPACADWGKRTSDAIARGRQLSCLRRTLLVGFGLPCFAIPRLILECCSAANSVHAGRTRSLKPALQATTTIIRGGTNRICYGC